MAVTPAVQNELEKLDMLLSKLDAVRYALPEVLDFFMTATGGLPATDNAQGTIQDYRYRVQTTERSLQNLQRSSASLAGSLASLTAQADRLKLDTSNLSRLRRNPYSGRIRATNDKNTTKLHKIPFPTVNEAAGVTSLEALNSRLRESIDKYSSLEIFQECEMWNKRSFVIKLDKIALFHVFLSWKHDGSPRFQRFNVVGLGEDKESFELSSMSLWQNIGIHATQAMGRHASKDRLDVSCLIALIDAYKSIQEVPCRSCQRLLHAATMQLPAARIYQSANAGESRGEWIAYHAECYSFS